jgi:hypothetical protein
MNADNLSAEQFKALAPFIETAKELKPILDAFPPDRAVGPPFPVEEWRALLAAFDN